MHKLEEGKIMNFLYNIQNRRRINPLYGIFTKEGLAYVIAGYVLFAMWGKGVMVFVLYLGVGLYIYKNKLNYRFYQQDRLHFYHMLTEYLSRRTRITEYEEMKKFISGTKEF
jgi:hypothetical protein